MTTRKPGLQRAPRQRGQALLLALLVLGVAGGAMLFSYYRPATLTLESDQKTTDALALVKTALIGWTVKRGDIAGNARPGEFPCPDTDNDGNVNTPCSAGQLGRVPWKALGIPEPKDSAGETLWYAVANKFRIRGSYNKPINSDTRGSITVYAADGTTTLTTEAAVVIFAPGRALGTQNRDPNTTAACVTTGTTIARNRCAVNYLETSGGAPQDNWRNNGPFINGQLSSTYNDRVVYLTTPEFMPSVEKRVASEVKAWLDGYRANSTCQCYPWAASFTIDTGDATDDEYATPSVTGRNRGRFPVSSARPEDWGGTRPVLSSWFIYNNWSTVIYYALAKQNANQQGADCLSGYCNTTTLSVDGKAVISAIFFTPGTPLGAITRPSNTLADYLEDAENNDNNDDIYVTPAATALDRDRIYTSISAPAAVDTSQQCRTMGRALRRITPCGQPPKLNPACAALAGTDLNGNALTPAQGLQVCSSACAAAALTLVNPPCQNTTRPSVCRNARETLEEC